MKIGDYFNSLDIIPCLASTTKEEVLAELTAKLVTHHDTIDRVEVFRVLLEREMLGSTGIGGGIAIPHAKLRYRGDPIVVFGRSTTGIAYDALDGKPVNLIFLLLAGEHALDLYLKLLAEYHRKTVRCGRLMDVEADALYETIREWTTGCDTVRSLY
jgi:PTS system nitrogen regulatory IIA component